MILGDLQEGVVIDHIPNGKGKALYHYLGLGKLNCQIALIEHADSKKLGKKDILKIGKPIQLDYDLLGYFDPKITINLVENNQVVKKSHPDLPKTLTNILHCNNPRCITSIERGLPHIFKLTDPKNKVYRCIYCDTVGEPDEE